MNEIDHRKRLAQILRYIANMHMQDDRSAVFVQHADPSAPDFFTNHNEDVLFSTQRFRDLVSMRVDSDAPEPFTFYAAASQTFTRKRTFGGSQKKAEKACWLRMVRTPPPTAPTARYSAVKQYLSEWLANTRGVSNITSLLTRARIEDRAPKIPPTTSREGVQQIKTYLRKYKQFLRLQEYHRILEPMYNSLFEWVNGTDFQLVWGLGHARVLLEDGTYVNGPLLEVLIEVELARDGALLLRPREHTGVTLHRQVISAIADDAQPLYKMVAEIEPTSLSPAQPGTYIPLLKQMAVQLRGRVQTLPSHKFDPRELVLTDSWCLWARPKPNSVWARDALTLADKIVNGSFELPLAAWSISHGPGSLRQAQQQKQAAGWLDWVQSKWNKPPEPPKPMLALPASASQMKIAELLLEKEYPAVVCEGPPGTGKVSVANPPETTSDCASLSDSNNCEHCLRISLSR